MGISIVRERLRNRAQNEWGPGGGAPRSSGVLYILEQFDGLIFFIHVYISVGDWMNTLFPLLSPPSPFFFSMPKSGGARAPPGPPASAAPVFSKHPAQQDICFEYENNDKLHNMTTQNVRKKIPHELFLNEQFD